jgi:hypothetical protein
MTRRRTPHSPLATANAGALGVTAGLFWEVSL